MKKELFFAFIAISIIAAAVSAPPAVYAHGTGASIEKEVDGYLIDVGYTPPEIQAGSSVRFDYGALNPGGELVDFESIWVKVTKGQATHFAAGIAKREFGPTTMIYTFPEGGEYDISVSFRKDGEVIVETTVPFTVQGGARGAGSAFTFVPFALGATGGLIAGLGVTFFVRRKTKTE